MNRFHLFLAIVAIFSPSNVYTQQQDNVLVLGGQQAPQPIVGQESVTVDLLSTIQSGLSGLFSPLPTPPAGCTQSFSADGRITPLGQDASSAAGQKYAICFQKKAGMCGVRFDLSSLAPKGLLDQFVTAVDGQSSKQQPMDSVPLPVGGEHHLEKRQVDLLTQLQEQFRRLQESNLHLVQQALNPGQRQQQVNPGQQQVTTAQVQQPQVTPGQGQVQQPQVIPGQGQVQEQVNVLNPADLIRLNTELLNQLVALKEQLLSSVVNKVEQKFEKVAPTPPPQPPPYGYNGNSIYHQPAQHHNHYQQQAPSVQSWQHAHKPGYGYQPMPEPKPLPKLPVIEKVVEVPTVPNPQITKTLTLETGLPGLLDLNNSISLGLPKSLVQPLANVVAPLVAPLAPLATPNNLPDAISETINLQNPLNPSTTVTVRRSRDVNNGQEEPQQPSDGQDRSSKCFRTMFLAPTSTSNAGHIVCLEEGKYIGPTEVIVLGEPIVALMDIGSDPSSASPAFNIPFNFVPC